MRSKSVAQLSSIQLIFERGTDELRARQLVAERISQITADPADVGEPAVHDAGAVLDQPDHEDRDVVGQVDLIDMSTIAYWKIRARLLRVPGVAQVAIWGERLPQRHVQVDPAKLAAVRRPAAAGDGRRRPTPWTPACSGTPTAR